MSSQYTDDVRRHVALAVVADGLVNVPAIARAIHAHHPGARLFEIEQLVLGFAGLAGVPIVFDRDTSSSRDDEGLMLEFVTEDDDEIGDPLPTGDTTGAA